MVENRSAESEVLRFDSSRGLRMFSSSHARDKTKNFFLYFDNCITLRWVQLFNGSPEFIRRVGTLSWNILMISALAFLNKACHSVSVSLVRTPVKFTVIPTSSLE